MALRAIPAPEIPCSSCRPELSRYGRSNAPTRSWAPARTRLSELRPSQTAARGRHPHHNVAHHMETVGTRGDGVRRTMSDAVMSPTVPDSGTDGPEAEPPHPEHSRKFPVRGVAIVAFLAVLGWWLFIADTAADNDLFEGF